MRNHAVIFDLDGTLLDTLADIATAANTVLQRHGFATYPLEEYGRLVGSGVRVLFERALADEHVSAETIARCDADFRAVYAEHWHDESQPYAGIAELLDELSARRLPMAVLSNKPHEFTVRCVEVLLPRWQFAAVLGQRPGVPIKPDPTAALEIARRLDVAPAECVYLGDTDVDMQTATRAGMHAIGVTWGFRPADELRQSGAAALIDHPRELLTLLDR
jgi:phosphoglycolate phosphatase